MSLSALELYRMLNFVSDNDDTIEFEFTVEESLTDIDGWLYETTELFLDTASSSTSYISAYLSSSTWLVVESGSPFLSLNYVTDNIQTAINSIDAEGTIYVYAQDFINGGSNILSSTVAFNNKVKIIGGIILDTISSVPLGIIRKNNMLTSGNSYVYQTMTGSTSNWTLSNEYYTSIKNGSGNLFIVSPDSTIEGLTITECVNKNIATEATLNTGNYGTAGAILCSGSSEFPVNAKIKHCDIKLNEAVLGGGAYIYNNVNPEFYGCLFTDNVASEGGSLIIRDIKVQQDGTLPLFTSCKFVGENSTIVIDYGSLAEFSQCEIESKIYIDNRNNKEKDTYVKFSQCQNMQIYLNNEARILLDNCTATVTSKYNTTID
ncbi:uncharacterized protein METZ01_LOCUS275037, partial [marine metagenome]